MLFGIVVVLLIVLVIVSNVKANNAADAKAGASASETPLVLPVEAAQVSKPDNDAIIARFHLGARGVDDVHLYEF
ncbi:hypothetical protein QF031_000949 [Pseudarthrobacter defluvii]|uniref:hypothetical protein n=1 Tax=Pseudarthrobacter defluvii TaxID=410837 RepID=UPI00277FB06B|nr:hypothetical protein [Pseudarthrobacter defluvii]MDQ0768200.1 hypothetical protein [Pseudarthrobacter defluvii]